MGRWSSASSVDRGVPHGPYRAGDIVSYTPPFRRQSIDPARRADGGNRSTLGQFRGDLRPAHAHLSQNYVNEMIRNAGGAFGIVPDTNVVTLHVAK